MIRTTVADRNTKDHGPPDAWPVVCVWEERWKMIFLPSSILSWGVGRKIYGRGWLPDSWHGHGNGP